MVDSEFVPAIAAASRRPPLVAVGVALDLVRAIGDSGLSNRELGEAAGVDPGMIARFVDGRRDLSMSTVVKLAAALGLRLVVAARAPRRRSK